MAGLREKMCKEKQRIREKERHEEQRRKFILGAICQGHAEQNAEFKTTIEDLLRAHVPKADRHLWHELFSDTPETEPGEAVAENSTPREEETA